MSNKKMISFEISDELREALRVAAFKNNTTISGAIRKVLEESLLSELSAVKEAQRVKESK